MIRNFISKLYSLYTPSFFMSGGGSSSGYVIERSLRFNAASSQYLTRTPASAGNRKTWTLSTWIKRGALGTDQGILAANDGVAGGGSFGFASDNTFFLTLAGVGTQKTSALFRDVGAHYHVVIDFDSTQAVQADRFIVYINNIQYLFTSNLVALNTDYSFNNNVEHKIGTTVVSGGTTYTDGYLSDYHFINAQRLPPSSFGETNTTTGQWVAKRYTGTYGNNGSYLDFKDGTSTTTLGYDKSGNTNHWTLTNFTRSAGVNDCWMLDVPAGNGSTSAVQPSGNYCVWNILDKITTSTLAGANLQTTSAASQAVIGSIGMTAGLYYWEVSFNAATAVQRIGVYGTTTHTADITPTTNTIGLRFNRDTGALDYTVDGTNYTSIATGLTTGTYFPYVASTTNAKVIYGNFGQRSFAYTPPTGFKALCTANLPTPAIKKPSDHFNVQLSTGANIKTDSEALFTNELEWIKDRANANNHQLIDSVRGSSAVLQSNTTGAETTYTAPSGSSVGWVWRASDSAAVTNNNGSISSQVSANPTAGFSVVTYTGVANGTVGHGLGVAPSMIIVKSRNSTASWVVYNKQLGRGSFLLLNTTNARDNSVANYWGTSEPTSSVFGIGNADFSNATGNLVAYCFAEVAGYSKFGSFTTNGTSDNTFIHLGFTPRFILFKATNAADAWEIWDGARNPQNVVDKRLQPNSSGAEAVSANLDIVSNGFKLRAGYTSGNTYIFMAFAETPFQYANAR
jgi:hypothetical protein